jgi:arylsulfatase A-like enzyme
VNFGGGRPDNDAHYIAQAIEYLDGLTTSATRQPFCLVLSLVNPHDVLAFPREWSGDYQTHDFEGSVELPDTFIEDLAANLKPTAHAAMLRPLDMILGPLSTPLERRQYVNFYANLTALIDRHISPLIDRFYGPSGTPTKLGEETIIVRIADHGELGLSHGGLRQKAFNVYEESLRVPFIISNPRLISAGRACEHLASLIDLMPTLASLLGVQPPTGLRGTDLSPLIRDSNAAPVQDEVLFTFDDMHAGSGLVREAVPAAGRIRCIREARFKYARYFHADGSYPNEYEMYDMQEDPLELQNLAHPHHPRYDAPAVVAERERLASKLAYIEDRLARPAMH